MVEEEQAGPRRPCQLRSSTAAGDQIETVAARQGATIVAIIVLTITAIAMPDMGLTAWSIMLA